VRQRCKVNTQQCHPQTNNSVSKLLHHQVPKSCTPAAASDLQAASLLLALGGVLSHTNTPGGSSFACATVKQEGGTAPALHLGCHTDKVVSTTPYTCCQQESIIQSINHAYQVHSSTASQLSGVALPWQGSAVGLAVAVAARPRLPLSCAAHAVCAAIRVTRNRTTGSVFDAMVSGRVGTAVRCQHRQWDKARHCQCLWARCVSSG
jgi:hypothetical protein